MFLCLNYCFICVEMTRLGELLHSMLFVGRWHLLYSITNAITEKIIASYAQMAASLVGPICDGGFVKKRSDYQTFF